jgi:hypothetical protein
LTLSRIKVIFSGFFLVPHFEPVVFRRTLSPLLDLRSSRIDQANLDRNSKVNQFDPQLPNQSRISEPYFLNSFLAIVLIPPCRVLFPPAAIPLIALSTAHSVPKNTAIFRHINDFSTSRPLVVFQTTAKSVIALPKFFI